MEFLSLTGKVESKRDRGNQRIIFLDSLCNSATGGQSKGLTFLSCLMTEMFGEAWPPMSVPDLALDDYDDDNDNITIITLMIITRIMLCQK